MGTADERSFGKFLVVLMALIIVENAVQREGIDQSRRRSAVVMSLGHVRLDIAQGPCLVEDAHLGDGAVEAVRAAAAGADDDFRGIGDGRRHAARGRRSLAVYVDHGGIGRAVIDGGDMNPFSGGDGAAEGRPDAAGDQPDRVA